MPIVRTLTVIAGLAFVAAADAAPVGPINGSMPGERSIPTWQRASNVTLLIEVVRNNPSPSRPTSPLNTLRDMAAAQHRCWVPPPLIETVDPPDVIFQVSYRRDGSLFGKPRIIEFSRYVTDAERGIYYRAVASALHLCAALPFTNQFGGAVAGTVFRIVLKDLRHRRRPQTASSTGQWLP